MSGKNFFEELLCNNEEMRHGSLDRLVDEINENKDRTIYKFLSDSGSEDLLWSLIELLSSSETRVASNAAYVIGSLAESQLGAQRVLSLTKARKASSIVEDLTRMLMSEDAECVMNSAGTLGTLAETKEGRGWMISQPCINEMLTNITSLLACENNWTASNAALVLARITISEDGCHSVLNHPDSAFILTRLIQSLGNDAAGRGMNSAFAIGRLLDMAPGKERLLNCNETEKMISTLCRMLIKGDMGSAKNACFAVSCLATNANGNQRVLGNNAFNDVISRLVLLLANEEDVEAAWFAAMTLRTISCHKQGVVMLRDNDNVISALNRNLNKSTNSKELNDEIEKTLALLRKLDCPDAPVVTSVSATTITLQWREIKTQSLLEITYKLYDGQKLIYKGRATERVVDQLTANTTHGFKLRASTVGDDSPFSEVVYATTEEAPPSAPCCLRVVGSTPTQIRFCWNPPEFPNGVLRGYSVYLGEKLMDTTMELSYIFGRLLPSTPYTIHVCGSTMVGVGERATITTCTDELGGHAPGKPSVTVIGRNEAHVTWNPPAVPLGRFFRFELLANKEVIYSGTDRSYKTTNLVPDTDYSFSVCAITSEGRCEGEPTKKRTLKDKTQIEPGRHKHKTHSFKAKEFQTVEKAKTQIKIERPKIRKKLSIGRPSSCVSTTSGKSKDEPKPGTWATEHPPSEGGSPEIAGPRKTLAVLSGASAKSHIKLAPPNGQPKMILRKSKSEYPIRSQRFNDPAAQSRITIEPVSWSEMYPPEVEPHLPRKPPVTKHKLKPVKSEPLETEKSYINLMPNKSSPNVPQIGVKRPNVPNLPHEMQLFREKHIFKIRERQIKRIPSSSSSDSSDDGRCPLPHPTDHLPKLIPLSMADLISSSLAKSTSDFNLNEPRKPSSGMKTPSKGYWSDHDAYTNIPHKKSSRGLAPINYRTFTGAHRPTMSYRQESPLVVDTWLSELPSAMDKNKYKFVPTQLRTQPLNLPKPMRSRHRLESLTQLDLRHDTAKRHMKFPGDLFHPAHQDGSIVLKDATDSPHTSSPFRSSLLTEEQRYSPHRAIVTHGDPV